MCRSALLPGICRYVERRRRNHLAVSARVPHAAGTVSRHRRTTSIAALGRLPLRQGPLGYYYGADYMSPAA